MTAVTLIAAVVILAATAVSVATYSSFRTFRRMRHELAAPVPSPALSAPSSAPKQNFLRVAGRLIAESDWSPEVLAQVRESYFRPPASGRQYLALVDITFTCAHRHRQLERVALVAPTPKLARLFSDGLLRSQAEMPCPDCRKPSRLSGRSVSWEGPFKDWDGAM